MSTFPDLREALIFPSSQDLKGALKDLLASYTGDLGAAQDYLVSLCALQDLPLIWTVGQNQDRQLLKALPALEDVNKQDFCVEVRLDFGDHPGMSELQPFWRCARAYAPLLLGLDQSHPFSLCARVQNGYYLISWAYSKIDREEEAALEAKWKLLKTLVLPRFSEHLGDLKVVAQGVLSATTDAGRLDDLEKVEDQVVRYLLTTFPSQPLALKS